MSAHSGQALPNHKSELLCISTPNAVIQKEIATPVSSRNWQLQMQNNHLYKTQAIVFTYMKETPNPVLPKYSILRPQNFSMMVYFPYLN